METIKDFRTALLDIAEETGFYKCDSKTFFLDGVFTVQISYPYETSPIILAEVNLKYININGDLSLRIIGSDSSFCSQELCSCHEMSIEDFLAAFESTLFSDMSQLILENL